MYILINPYMRGLIKIGLTTSTPEKRAKQLSAATGVPGEFVVIYDELVSDCRLVERELHNHFAGYRAEINREFFTVPPKDAIKALQNISKSYSLAKDDYQFSKSIIDELRKKFGRFVKSDIILARIVQTDEICFFEIQRSPYAHLSDIIIERVDLGIISGEADEDLFKASDIPDINAQKFVREMDPASILNCTPSLFDEKFDIEFNGKSYEEIEELIELTKDYL